MCRGCQVRTRPVSTRNGSRDKAHHEGAKVTKTHEEDSGHRHRDTELATRRTPPHRGGPGMRTGGNANTKCDRFAFPSVVCPDSRPAAPACVRRVARLAACAPDLRVSVSPWQNPWTRSQRDIVADFARFSAGFAVSAFDVLLCVSVSPWQNPWTRSQRDIVANFARFSAGFAVSAFDVLLCVSVSPWQNPWTRPQRDIVARFGRFVFVPPRPAFVPRLAATKHYNRRPSVRVR